MSQRSMFLRSSIKKKKKVPRTETEPLIFCIKLQKMKRNNLNFLLECEIDKRLTFYMKSNKFLIIEILQNRNKQYFPV